MKIFLISLLCLLSITTFAQNFTIQNNTQSVTILPNAIQTNRPEMTGKSNVSIGKNALRVAGTGPVGNINSIAIGDSALSNTYVGAIDVIAIGVNAAKNTGSQNSVNGPGIENIAIGKDAFLENTTGYGNLAIGHKALKKGNNNLNIAIGHDALKNLNFGDGNLAIGSIAMSEFTEGIGNVTVGGMQYLRSGSYNTAIGNRAMGRINAGGSNNTSLGNYALYSNSATNNTAVGSYALIENISGESNVSIGAYSLNINQIGKRNVAVGTGAGGYFTGSNNIFLGYQAGRNAPDGSYKLYISSNEDIAPPIIYGDLLSGQIGFGTNLPANQFVISQKSSSLPNYAQWTNSFSGQTDSDGLEIGIQAGLDAFIWQNENKPLIIGTNNAERLRINASGSIGVGRTATTNIFEVEGEASKTTAGSWVGNSDKRLKKNITYISSQDALQKVLQMKGAYYEWNDNATNIKRPKGIQFGFIAQDLQEVFPTKVKTDNLGYLQTAYGDYDPMFVEAIKALNDKIERLEKENTSLKIINNELLSMKNEFADLKAMINRKTPLSITK
jgi:trimeric autotransporter adhesin